MARRRVLYLPNEYNDLLTEVQRLRKHKKVLDRLYKMADADPDLKELIDELWEAFDDACEAQKE